MNFRYRRLTAAVEAPEEVEAAVGRPRRPHEVARGRGCAGCGSAHRWTVPHDRQQERKKRGSQAAISLQLPSDPDDLCMRLDLLKSKSEEEDRSQEVEGSKTRMKARRWK